MYKSRSFVFAAIFLCILGAQVASAQTISPYQGNGQLICLQCTILTVQGVNSGIAQQFSPLYARVTDSNGNPVANATVFWSISTGGQYLILPSSTTTTTDSNGLTDLIVTAPFTSASANGPVQSTILATVSGSGNSTTFTLTQTSVNVQNDTQVDLSFPTSGQIYSGNAGTSGTPIQVGIFARGNTLAGATQGPLAGISIKLVNYQTGATATCATASGADPGSGLSDNSGYATCTPIFSGKGNGQFAILIGGTVWSKTVYADGTQLPQQPPYVSVPPNNDPGQTQPTYSGGGVAPFNNLQVTPATVGSVQLVSGNNQTGNAGQSLASPLVVSVTSTAGGAIPNQAVTWTVTPSNGATLGSSSTTTDLNGRTSNTVTLSQQATGTVTVTATAGSQTASFTITAVVPTQVSSLTKASGDNQTAVQNTAFASPLVVHISVSSGSVANQNVQWSVSGPATLSATSVATDSNGNSSVNVTAGGTPGAVTVTASLGSLTPVTFNLTVSAPGPQLSSGTFMNGADFQKGYLSPCGIATVVAAGLAPNISGVVTSYNIVGYLNYTVAGDTVTVGGAQAPIYNVANINGTQQITFQVPCSVSPGTSVPVAVTVGGGSATVNTTILPASPGVFQSQYTVTVQGYGTLPLAVVAKRDGTLVSPTNPARRNETVIAYVTGVGPVSPSVATNALPIFGTAATVSGQVIVGINNAGVPVTFAQMSEDLIGVAVVAFQIPSSAPQGNEVFSIGIVPPGSTTAYYSNPAAIYIQ